MGENDSFGEISLLEECRRTCNAVCMSPVICFSLAKPFFDLLLKQKDKVALITAHALYIT
jgi:CRP-like cAMP-binding protein